MANLNGQLVIANGQYEFKHGDTDSEIQFVAYDMQGSKVSLQKDGSAKFVISNAMGVCKMPTATSAAGYIFKLKTSDLSALPAGNYTVELDVMDAKGGKRIFPVNNSNTVITITADALTVTNGVVPTTSLGDFENDLKNYTQQQTTQATNDIQSKFKDYADSLQNSVTAGVDKATTAANNALTAAQKALTQLQQPIGTRNLLLDSRNGKSAPWVYKNTNTGSTLMNCYIGKANTAWSKAIGAYNVYDLYQRGLYNTTDTYTFSCYAKIDGTIKLRQGDISFYCTATDSNGKGVDVSNVNSDTWTRISIPFKFTNDTPPQNDGSATLRFEPDVSWDGSGSHAGVGTGYLYLACPQLEKGATVSDYHPAPEDDYSMIQQMQSQIVALTQKIATLQTK